MKRLDRRTFLRGAAGTALALPLLEAMSSPRRARAQEMAAPRRIIFVFSANGDETDQRFATMDETSFELGEFLQPLEAYRDQVLLINKLHKRYNKLPSGEKADNHQQGGSALAPWPSGSGSFPIGGEEGVTIGYVTGPSIDYEIGERVLQQNPNVPYRHLVYRVGGKSNNIWNLHSHAGPVGQQNPVEPETDPYQAYARIFSFTPEDTAAQEAVRRRLLKRQSALDLVKQELTALTPRVSVSDRQRLEQHAEALRDIERTLAGGSGSAECRPVELGEEIDPYHDDNHQVIGSLFFKISALAFACDLTRVVNFNWSGNTSNRVYRNLDLTEGHHDISHNSDGSAFEKIRKVKRHLWTLSTGLYEELKAIPDGASGESLWDNTLVVHWDELGQGDSHSINDQLVVLAGGAQGHFRMGRLLDFDNDAGFSDVLVSCLHYMGFTDVDTFGDERLATGGPLPNLV
ncbi:MAG TPA: DUF1552 domain-containing protein [Polyangiaceae bacterium]|nr:DUF1552 domain-containing protein [Polyangiaceae bacterium]